MNQFTYQSASILSRLIREGKATSTEIVTAHLQRIKEFNDKTNALVTVFEEEALATAATRDAEAKAGNFRGPLHGVPITIKEQFWIKGKRSTINANMHKDFTAPEDSVLVDRIRQSGAVILGQTNVPKFLTDYQVWGDIYPEGKNPYNTDHTPGGSTGGGAAALAAGFTPLELGGDLGGSVRVPANYCGVFGLKPTDKTVPMHGGIPLPPGTKTVLIHMAQAGPLARDIDDLETLWNIIKGPHPEERDIPRIDWQEPKKKSLAEFRIAWVDGWPNYPASTQVKTAIGNLIERIKEQGGHTENKGPEGDLHHQSLRLWMGLFPYIIGNGVPWFIRPLMKLQQKGSVFKGAPKPYIRELDRAYKMRAGHYAEMLYLKNQVTKGWETFFRDFDFLICPVAFGPAFPRTKIGTRLTYDGKEMAYGEYTWPFVGCFNASGNPCLNIPLGLGEEGLPLGVQIVGPWWSEPGLINFARQIIPLTEGFVRPPGY